MLLRHFASFGVRVAFDQWVKNWYSSLQGVHLRITFLSCLRKMVSFLTVPMFTQTALAVSYFRIPFALSLRYQNPPARVSGLEAQ